MKRLVAFAALALAGCSIDGPAPPQIPPPPPRPTPPAYPATRIDPVVDAVGSLSITDPYRWLEDGKSEEVTRWIDAQNRFTRGVLDKFPGQRALADRIRSLESSESARHDQIAVRPGVVFALEIVPPKEQWALVAMKPDADVKSARVLVDPNAIDKTGRTTIDFYAPSVDGKLVAVSLSQGGTEDGTVHVVDVATGKETGDVIPHVNGGTAGGSVTWNASGTGFWYTRYPKKGERPDADLPFYQQAYFHKLGDKLESDAYVLGKELPKIVEITMQTRADGKLVLLRAANGDGGEVAYYLGDASGKFAPITTYADKITEARFGADGRIYLLSHQGAPRGKIVRVPADKPVVASAELVVPEGKGTIKELAVTSSKLFVTELLGGPSVLRVFDLAGKELAPVALPPVARVEGLVAGEGDDVFYSVTTYLAPTAWYRANGASAPVKTSMAETSRADFSDAEVLREECTSKDGTKVPLTILWKKGTKRTKDNPTLLTAYGGFDISMEPSFKAHNRVMLDADGVVAIANLRGGGEFGEAWHEAGMKTKKQNVFDDFIGCAEHLVKTDVTAPDRLAIRGGSNGGLLMGAAVTQRPDLFQAVVGEVGLFDMLRFENDPNGVFIATEYGSVKNPDELRALYAYSPYHRVVEGTRYPATLLTAGTNDPRVAAWHARKMAARLQSASAGQAPILLLTRDAGHGIGSSLSQKVDDLTDLYSFVFFALEVDYQHVASQVPRKTAP